MKKAKRKQMTKKIGIFLLSFIVITTSIGGFLYHTKANSYTEPSRVLLDSMLNGERAWVIDTIVNDNRDSNPYGNESSLMATALSQYENKDDPDYNVVYSKMVDILNEFYYNNSWDQDLTTFAAENTASIVTLFTDNDSFFNFVDDLEKTAEEEQYESILTSVFTDEYISSWGESVNNQEASLRELNELSDSVKNASKLTTYWKNLYNFSLNTAPESYVDYTNDVLEPLMESGLDFFKYFDELDVREQQVAGSIVTLASIYSGYLYSSKRSEYYNFGDLDQDLIDYLAGEGAKKLISSLGDKLNCASGLINQYTFLNSVASQKEQYYDTLLRLSNQAYSNGDTKMSKAFNDFAEKMDDAVDGNQLSYDMMIQAFSSTALVSKELKISKAFEVGMPEALKLAYKSSGLKEMSATFDTGMWVVDQATGIKESCMKIYELKYLRKMINRAVEVYRLDLKEYQNDKTDENARKVLDDLMILQRLRLRGENISYKMTQGQLNSGIGRLISGFNSGDWSNLDITEDTDLAKSWEKHYQNSIDCLIGASLDPFSFETFKIASGEKVVISYDTGKNTYVGYLTKNGEMSTLCEMQYRILGGIQLSGGELIVKDASIPYLTASGGSVKIDASTVSVGELTQTGTASIAITNGDIAFSNSLELQDTTISASGTLSTPDLTLTGDVNLSDGDFETTDLHLKKIVSTNADIICFGNLDSEYSDFHQLSNLTVNGSDEQKINANLKTVDLTLDNANLKGVLLDGKIQIGGELYDPRNILTSGLTLMDSADIRGSDVASDVILNGTTISNAVNFNRGVTVEKNAYFHGGTIKGKLYVLNGSISNESNSMNLKNGVICSSASAVISAPINIYSDAFFDKSEFSGTGNLNLFCNSDSRGTENTFNNLVLCGTSPQEINFDGAVKNLEINNTSIKGVTFGGTVVIEELLKASNQNLTDGNKLILTGGANADLSNVSGNLAIKDWEGSWIGGLSGTLYATGSNVISNNMELTGGIRQDDGTITVNSNTLVSLNESALFNGTIVNNGIIAIGGDTVFNMVDDSYGSFICSGDIRANKECNIDSLTCNGSRQQIFSGSDIKVRIFSLDGTYFSSAKIDNKIFVTEHLSVANEKISGGKNIIITDSASVQFSNVSSDLTMKDWNGQNAQINGVKGMLYTEGTNIIHDDFSCAGGITQVNGNLELRGVKVTTGGTLKQTDGNMIIDEESDVAVNSDMVLQGMLQNEGELAIKGDFLATNQITGEGKISIAGDVNMQTTSEFGSLTINGSRGQIVNGADITVGDLSLTNTSLAGVTLNSQIYVKNNYTKSCILHGKKPIQKLAGNIISESKEIGSISSSDETEIGENIEVIVKDDINMTGNLILHKNAIVTVQGNLVLSSNTLVIEEGAKLTVKGNIILSSVTVKLDGEWMIRQDALLKGGSLSGSGKLVIKGDLDNNGTISGLQLLSISGKAPITISGNEIHVNSVDADNTSAYGVELLSKIYYSDTANISDKCKITENYFMEEQK